MTWSYGFTARISCILWASQGPGCIDIHVCDSCCPSRTSLLKEALKSTGRAPADQPTASAHRPMFWTFLINANAQKSPVLLPHYLCSFSKGPSFPSTSCPGLSQIGVKYTKKTALSGMIYEPPARVPSVSSRPHSLGQVLLRSWPWECHQRSDKDDVESVSDFSTGQWRNSCDEALLEELVRLVMGSTREERGPFWLRSWGQFASVTECFTGNGHTPQLLLSCSGSRIKGTPEPDPRA